MRHGGRTDIDLAESAARVSVAVVTPSGLMMAPTSSECVAVETVQEYVLVTLRELRFREEGVYRFALALDGRVPDFIDLPVLTTDRPLSWTLH